MATTTSNHHRNPCKQESLRISHMNINPAIKGKIGIKDLSNIGKQISKNVFLSYCYERNGVPNREVEWTAPYGSFMQNIQLNSPHQIGVMPIPLTKAYTSIVISTYDCGVPLTLPSKEMQFLAEKYDYLIVILSHQLLRSKSDTPEMKKLKKILKDNDLRLLDVSGPFSKVSWRPDLLIVSEKLFPHLTNVNSYDVTIPSFPSPAFLSYVDVNVTYFCPNIHNALANMNPILRNLHVLYVVFTTVYAAALTYLPEYQTGKAERKSKSKETPKHQDPTKHLASAHCKSESSSDVGQLSDKKVNKSNSKNDTIVNKQKATCENASTKCLTPEVADLVARRRQAFSDFQKYGRSEDMEKYLELMELVKTKLKCTDIG